METNPAITSPCYNELILTVPMQNLLCYNKYFVLLLTVSKNIMMIQMIDKRNAALIGQDGEL